ncbi:MAG TPA: choice-of-anchor J domain-containing protein [Clostridiales bacterium]|nr:choice-of-anchor J domain-containing protein [Clostridiales bacterium]
MKRLVLVAALMFSVGVSAMVWEAEDFEDGSFGDITVYDNDGDSDTWEVVPYSAGKTGNYMIRSASSPGLTPDNEIAFENGLYLELDSYMSFWVGAEDPEKYSETFQIWLYIEGAADSRIIYEETLSSSEWKLVTIDLKPFLLENDPNSYDAVIYAGIRHFNTTDQSALVIDDIMFKSLPVYLYDEDLFSIPPEVVNPLSSIDMKFYIYDYSGWNEGGDFIGYKQCDLHYVITDDLGTHSEETLPLSITPSDDPNYPDLFFYTLTMEGKPMGTKMEYWVETMDNSGYDIVGKSEIFNVEWGEINYIEDFENPDDFDQETMLPEGWVTFQLGDDQGNTRDNPWVWNISSSANSHSGEYSVTSASQTNFGVWMTDDYLVTPRIRINGKPTVKYFINAQTSPGEEFTEKWSLLISKVEGDGTDIENFTELLRDSIIPDETNINQWIEKTCYLGDYQDEYVRIMWRHIYNPLVSVKKLDRFFNIDDVSIQEMPVMTVHDPGNAANPGEDFAVTVTATDYSGINNVTIFYRINAGEEQSVVMTDNGDDTFTGLIPAQSINTKCSWYCVVTDNSAFSNTTRSSDYVVVWFDSGVLEWGSIGTAYNDPPDFINGGDKVAIDWNFGTKEYLYLNKIEIGWNYDASNISWKLVEFDPNIGNLDEYDNPIGAPTDNVIGDLQGIHNFAAGGDTLHIEDGKNTPIYGHVGLVFQTPVYNEIMLDESGDKSHAWQWNSVTKWTTNLWGAFYIKMYVSQIPNGIENEFVSSTTELCQNYPNPFNPSTSISFYNRIPGEVNLSVYNVLGEKVATLINEKMNEGFRKVNFDASKLNSGVYYYTLKTPEKMLTNKMILIK